MIQLEERLYTSTEVAEILGVSLRSVYRYLEENKLDAEIKTATGRHRFSKKNIMDFLYPNGQDAKQTQTRADGDKKHEEEIKIDAEAKKKEEAKISKEELNSEIDKEVEKIVKKQVEKKPQVEVKQDASEDDGSEEPIDWLAKFREAAKKFKEETEAQEKSTPVQAPEIKQTEPEKPQPAEDLPQEKFSGFSTYAQPAEEKPSARILHYRSSLGGLKDIAQNIDKTSRNSGVPYAFTMNAGLSLFKPIKPFSLLHAYVKSSDLQLFERTLGLTPAEESTAQLCLLITSDTAVFSQRQEVHGLFVVSKEKLLDDIKKIGDGTLVEEAKSVL